MAINAISFGKTETANNNKQHAAYAAGGAVIGAAAGGLAGANSVKLLTEHGDITDKFYSAVTKRDYKFKQKMTQETFDKIKKSPEFLEMFGKDITLERFKKVHKAAFDMMKIDVITEKNKKQFIDCLKEIIDNDLSDKTIKELQEILDFNKEFTAFFDREGIKALVDTETKRLKKAPKEASDFIKMAFDEAKSAVREMKLKSAAKYGAAAAAILGLAGLSISALKNKD